jgi:hypothetical protein
MPNNLNSNNPLVYFVLDFRVLPILSCLVLSCLVLSCLVMSCLVVTHTLQTCWSATVDLFLALAVIGQSPGDLGLFYHEHGEKYFKRYDRAIRVLFSL